MPTTTDDRAQAERLIETAPMVRRMCASRLGPHDGQDAAQDVLEAVWRAQHRPDFDDDGSRSLHGYAATLARYRVLHGYADRGRGPVASGDLGEPLWADPGPGPAEQVTRANAVQAAVRQVAELLAQLPPRERQVMLASGLGARPSAETAAELDMSPTAVRSAQVRAMARMREIVGVGSPNPLASAVPETERRRQAAAARSVANGTAGRGPGGAPLPVEVHQAGRSAAAAGRTTHELAAEFGVSERTASRWQTDAARAAASEEGRDQQVHGEGSDDPLARARAAVAGLPDHVAERADHGWQGWDTDATNNADAASCDDAAIDSAAAGAA